MAHVPFRKVSVALTATLYPYKYAIQYRDVRWLVILLDCACRLRLLLKTMMGLPNLPDGILVMELRQQVTV